MKWHKPFLLMSACAALMALVLAGCGGGGPGNPKFRFIHDATAAGAVDVYVEMSAPGTPVDLSLRTPAYANIVKGDSTPYRVYKDGDYEVAVTTAGSKTPIIRRYWPFPDGKRVTARLVENAGVPQVDFRFD